LNHGEVGAFLSHRQIWEAIVDKGLDAALILEDDLATNDDRFEPAVGLALKHVLNLGYVKMGEQPGKGETSVIDRAGVVYLSQSMEPGLGATGQVVSREAARILIEKSPVFDRPVDTFVQSHWFTGLRPANVHPAGLHHIDQELGGTTIQVKHKKWLPKIQRELLRFHYRRGVRRFSQNSSAPFRIAH
jgi:GR25 family glycosyltransferase involved in LPS biosynthesis